MSTTFPGESPEYRAARDRLLDRETELRRAMEEVAVARRGLPPGGIVPEDYGFQGADGDVTLSELSRRAAGRGDGACPSCTAMLDQLDGAAEHVSQRLNLVAVAKAPLPRVLAFAEQRGWERLRVLSSALNTYNRDYQGETAEGSQMPMLNVFHRHGGTIRHFWGTELLYAPTEPGQDPRHVGTIEPLWNLFDLTPEGRAADWDEQLSYA